MGNGAWVCDDEVSKRFPVYTRANAGEVFTVVVSPLTWTAYGRFPWELGFRDSFYEMGAFTPDEFKPAGSCEVIGCFGGYIYLNVSVNRVFGVRTPGLTAEAIDASFFGSVADAPAYRPDPRDENPERSAQIGAWMAALQNYHPRQETDVCREQVETVAASRPDFGQLADVALLDYFRSLRDHARVFLKQHLINTNGCNVLTGMVAQLCQSVGAGDSIAKISAAIGDVDSAGQSFDLWALSRQVKASRVLSAAFDAGVEGLLPRLRNDSSGDAARFLEGWNAFIGRWGFLGPDVWEFRSPTYRTEPEMVLRMLNRTRQAPDSAAPSQRGAQLDSEREAAIAEVGRRLAGNSPAQEQFEVAAHAAADFLAARERSKVVNTRLNEEARAAVRELGQRLVKRGLLAKWEHVLLVTNDEADDFVADPGAFSRVIGERATMLDVLMRKEPPFIFESEPLPLSEWKERESPTKNVSAQSGRKLQGIGVSPGKYRGRARIVKSLAADSMLEPGEVIVAVTTDSTWGPLFLAAGAIVVETGSTISHAAIVSRELGIPAAVSVGKATQLIADGAMITVDGDTGTVTVD